MIIQDNVNVGPKTTMKIGGRARYYVELATREDAEEAWTFAQKKKIPLIVLGGGANTVFADGIIEALVVRITADTVRCEGATVTAEAGAILASMINECAKHGLDLSALAGIPGTLGGALVGNAGQGPAGTWLDSFVRSVTVFADGTWQTLTKEQCRFSYRESIFKHWPSDRLPLTAYRSPIVWEAALNVPSRPQEETLAEVERLLKKRFETQPHRRTAGSCFKAVDGTPAWKLIDEAGLRGYKVGGIQISEKHANFLLNEGNGTFADLTRLLADVRAKVPRLQGIEMRLYGADGVTSEA